MTEFSKNTQTPQCDKTAVMPCFYHFDVNRRVYEKDGMKRNSPYYDEHFVKIEIIEETEKEYICKFGRTINKRSMLYKIDSSTRKKVFTEQEKEDDIYVNSKANSLAELVRKSDANTLREIEWLLSVK
jgi:type I restriction-modification system DNA methylase subunit